eukprot:1704765-Lingulodinium_polyedra.AAC.1
MEHLLQDWHTPDHCNQGGQTLTNMARGRHILQAMWQALAGTWQAHGWLTAGPRQAHGRLMASSW